MHLFSIHLAFERIAYVSLKWGNMKMLKSLLRRLKLVYFSIIFRSFGNIKSINLSISERTYRKRRKVSENQDIEDRLESLILRVGEKVNLSIIL